MSITSTIQTMRRNEILSELPNMDMNTLHAHRKQLKDALYSRQNNPDVNKQNIADITLIITREIHKRAEAQQVKDGDDPKSQNEAVLNKARQARGENINRIAKRKLAEARFDFDALPANDKLNYLDSHNGKNPYELTIKYFGGTSE